MWIKMSKRSRSPNGSDSTAAPIAQRSPSASAGIAASAPYLHDGSAPTLRAVLSTARTGEMGNTGRLSEAQMDDLEAYLKSL